MDGRQKAGPEAASADDGESTKRFRLDLSAALAAAVQIRLGFEGARQRIVDGHLADDVRALEIRLFDLEEMLVGLLTRNKQSAATAEPSATATKQVH